MKLALGITLLPFMIQTKRKILRDHLVFKFLKARALYTQNEEPNLLLEASMKKKRKKAPSRLEQTSQEKENQILLSPSTQGGAHCCLFFHIFEIGDEFRHIQTIDLAHSDLADFKNLDRDPALELPINDWTFAYWKTGFAGSPAPEVILKYSRSRGKYEMAPGLMRKPARSPEELKETATKIRLLQEWKDTEMRIPVELWAEMLDLIYTGNMNQAWKLVDLAWPAELKGKQEFLDEFKAQLKTSKLWKEIVKMNEN